VCPLTSPACSIQKFLYVGSQIAHSINVFRRNAKDGSLARVGWETEGQNGVSNLDSVQDIIVSHDGRHIYAALDQGDGISAFDTRADMSIVKTDSSDPVVAGGALSYTLAVTNNGPSEAQHVVVTDALPAGAGFVKATVNAPGASCGHDSGTLTCQLGTLASTAAVTAVVEVTAPAAAGTLDNTASVAADQLDTDTANNSDSETTCVDAADTPTCSSADGGGTGGAAPPTTTPSPGGTVAAGPGDSGGGGGVLAWLVLTGLASATMGRRLRHRR
jgi:uncharacterized repeat protein (TIGR01451 family)